jgi:nucleoside 2-deoxyribosyltransferase
MMQFTSSPAHTEIVRVVKETLLKHGIVGLRADDKQYMDDLFPNVKVYMHACDFGLAIFERIEADDFNPNVSLEVGYMFGMGKDVLLLKDKTLSTLPTDLTGRLYREFDTRAAAATAPPEIVKWLSDKGLA